MNTVDFSQFGASGAVVLCVVLFLNFLKKQDDKRNRNDKQVAVTLANANRKSTKELSSLIKGLDSYIKGHNGRQSELHSEMIKGFKEMIDNFAVANKDRAVEDDKILNEIRSIKVKNQEVEHQHVKEQVVDREKL